MSRASSSHGKVGLALGSGAARGLAHIGVLKILEEADVPLDLIAGTSMGAFIGALYAADVPIKHIEETARGIDWRRLARLLDPVIPTSGLIDGKKLMSFMAELLPVRTFEELKLPLAITTTDIETGEALVIKQGDLLQALRAGLAFPGIFSPARFGNRFLVDGGLNHPVPTEVVRNLGADHVIGICAIPEVHKQTPEAYLPAQQVSISGSRPWRDLFNARSVEHLLRKVLKQHEIPTVNGSSNERKTPNIFKVCAQSVAIMENEINQLRLEKTSQDLVIRPQLNDVTLLEFHRAAEIIAAGEAAAKAALPEIHKLLGRD